MASFKVNRAEYERLKKLSPEEIKSETERLQKELKAKEDSNLALKKAIAQEEAESLASEERIKNLLIRLKKITEDIEVKTKQSKYKADELKDSIALKQKKLDDFKAEKKIEIDQLKATLEEFKRSKTPNSEDSTLDQEFIDLLEKNAKLKEELNNINMAIEEKECELVNVKEQFSKLESDLLSRKEYLASLQQSLKDSKENYQAKYDEKICLESSLTQMKNPQSAMQTGNSGSSLFKEVDDSTSNISSQYRQIKAKYTKAKEILAKQENEISKLKTDSLRLDQALNGFITERKSIAQDREYYKMKRIKDLKRSIELAKANIEKSTNTTPHTITNSYGVRDLDAIEAVMRDMKKEGEIIQKEIDDILINQIPVRRRVNALNIDINNAKSQLKQLIQENIKIQSEINQLEGEKNTSQNMAGASSVTGLSSVSGPPSVAKEPEVRKVHFSEDVE